MFGINFFGVFGVILFVLQRAMMKALDSAISKIDFLCEMVRDLSSELPDLAFKEKLLTQLVEIMLHCKKVLLQASKQSRRERINQKRRRKLLRQLKDVSLN